MNTQTLSSITGFPEEVLSNLPRVVVYGDGRALIEQHQGIVTYQKDIICFQSALGVITFRGNALEIVKYGWQDAVIKGQIESLTYTKKG